METTSRSDAALSDLGLRAAEVIYANPLGGPGDCDGWRLEGPGAISFPCGRLRLESTGDPAAGQRSNLVLWCPRSLPDHVRISWRFTAVREPGLAILFFAAVGHGGRSVLDPSLAPRSGPYDQYHHGDLDALHVSYFRRRFADELRLHTCNLRKSHGFHLVAMGGDPLPAVAQATPPYRLSLIKAGPLVRFAIEDLVVFTWRDDGTRGPVLGGGHIGFRQMAPLIAEYADLRVERLTEGP